MGSFWTTGKIILVTICGSVVVGIVGKTITDAVANASAGKTARLATRENLLTDREREKTKQERHKAEKARYEAEIAATKAACDDCANFASRDEVKRAEGGVG